MFKKKYHKRSSNPLFVIFRLILSLIMFAVLLDGGYTAYKHFSGLDPLKLDPQSIIRDVVKAKTPKEFLAVLSAIKINQIIPSQISQKVLEQSNQTTNNLNQTISEALATSTQPTSAAVFKFLLIADSHNDNANLRKALNQAKGGYPDLSFIIGLGDYTDVGTLAELNNAKKELDSIGLRYFVIPGDHDMWDSRDKQTDPVTNFRQVFGPTFQSFVLNNFYFILLNNGDNYKGFLKDQQDWIGVQLEKAKSSKGIFVFIHEPLYHPSSDHFMGRVEKDLKLEAQNLIYQLKTAGVRKVFFGDIHYFSEYEEPVTKLPMVTIGSVGSERNPQAPRFAVVTVFADGLTKVEDVEIK